MPFKFNPFTGTFDDVSLDTVTGDLRYLKLDCSNDPLTGDLEFSNNTITVAAATSADLQTAINAATAGDRLILTSGAISFTSVVTIDKSLYIDCTATTFNIPGAITGNFAIIATASNVTLLNPKWTMAANQIMSMFKADGSAGTVLSGVNLINPEITTAQGASDWLILYNDASGNIYRPIINGTEYSSSYEFIGIAVWSNSTAEAAVTVNIYSPVINLTGQSSSAGHDTCCIKVVDNGTSQAVTVNVFNPTLTALNSGTRQGYPVYTQGSDVTLNLYGGTYRGKTYDIYHGTGTLNVYGAVNLYGNLVYGTPNFYNTTYSHIVYSPPVSGYASGILGNFIIQGAIADPDYCWSGANYYHDGANGRYYGDGYSSMIGYNSGVFEFWTAPLGAAGGVCTLTKRMGISNLGVVDIPGLTESNLVFTDGSKNLVSVAVVPILNGGTNGTSFTTNFIPYFNGTSLVDSTISIVSGLLTIQDLNSVTYEEEVVSREGNLVFAA